MDEMTKTIIFLLIISGLIASIIEAVKKAISIKQVVKGKERIKTRLSRKVIISLSMLFSILFVLLAYSGGVLIGRLPIIFLYIAIVFVQGIYQSILYIKETIQDVLKFEPYQHQESI